jgi:hypothetical protein
MGNLVVARHDGTVQKIISGGVKHFRIWWQFPTRPWVFVSTSAHQCREQSEKLEFASAARGIPTLLRQVEVAVANGKTTAQSYDSIAPHLRVHAALVFDPPINTKSLTKRLYRSTLPLPSEQEYVDQATDASSPHMLYLERYNYRKTDPAELPLATSPLYRASRLNAAGEQAHIVLPQRVSEDEDRLSSFLHVIRSEAAESRPASTSAERHLLWLSGDHWSS